MLQRESQSKRRRMTTIMTTTTRQHDEPRSTPAMSTPVSKTSVGSSYDSRPNSASPKADCQGHCPVSREPARQYYTLSTRVLSQHAPAGIAGTHTSRLAAIPELQTLRILPLYYSITRIQGDRRQKGQGPKLKPTDKIQDMISTRAESCTGSTTYRLKKMLANIQMHQLT